MQNTFLFTGRPGAGKGTQAKILADKLSAKFVSSGGLLRDFVHQDTPVSKKVGVEIDQGKLLPYWIPAYLFHTTIFSLKADEPVVLDGFARRLREARIITETLDWIERPFTVINLDIPEEVVRARVEHRKQEEHRGDEESVEKRLEEYALHTKEALNFFKEHATVIDIDGTKTVEEVTEDIWNTIQ